MRPFESLGSCVGPSSSSVGAEKIFLPNVAQCVYEPTTLSSQGKCVFGCEDGLDSFNRVDEDEQQLILCRARLGPDMI